MKVIAKKEAKLTEVIKRYGEVKEAYDKLKQYVLFISCNALWFLIDFVN